MSKIFVLLIFVCALKTTHSQRTISEKNYNDAVDYYNTARESFASKEYSSAIKNFRLAFILNPDNSDYSFGLSGSYYELQLYDSALKYIGLAINLQPNQPDYHNLAGNIYFHKKKYMLAVENYNITLTNKNEKTPTYNCIYNKAVCNYYLKNYVGAIESLNDLVVKYPTNSSYLYYRGISYIKIKQYKSACQDLKKALDHGYTNANKYIIKFCK